MGISIVQEFCERLKIPNEYKRIGIACCKEHMKFKCISNMRHKGKQYKYLMHLQNNFDIISKVSLIDSIYRDSATPDGIADDCINYKFAQHTLDIAQTVTSRVTGNQLKSEGYEEGEKLGNELLQRRIRKYIELINNKAVLNSII